MVTIGIGINCHSRACVDPVEGTVECVCGFDGDVAYNAWVPDPEHRAMTRESSQKEPTPAENNRRSESPTALNALKGECRHGHPFDERNTYISPVGGRACRECQRRAGRAYRARIKEAS